MIRFSFSNVLKEATVTASSAKVGSLANNTVAASFSDRWESASPFVELHTLEYTFNPTTVSCIGLFALEVDPEAELTIRLYNGVNLVKEITLPAYQVVYGYGEGPYGLFGYGGYSAPGREWVQQFKVLWLEDIYCDKLSIEFSGSQDVSLGYVHLGPSWSPPFGISRDYNVTFDSTRLDILRNPGGVSIGSVARQYRCVSVTLQLMRAEDVEDLYNLYDGYSPLVFTAFAEKESTEAIYSTMLGRITGGIDSTGAPHSRYTAAGLKIEECK